MKLYRKESKAKLPVATDDGKLYYVIKGYLEVEDKQDIEYFKERGFKEVEIKKKGGK